MAKTAEAQDRTEGQIVRAEWERREDFEKGREELRELEKQLHELRNMSPKMVTSRFGKGNWARYYDAIKKLSNAWTTTHARLHPATAPTVRKPKPGEDDPNPL